MPFAQLVFANFVVTRFLPVRAIQDEEVAVAAGLSEQFAFLAVDLAVDQNRRFVGIPVVRVVRRRLEIPGHLSGVGIQRDDRLGVEVVAFAALAGDHGLRVAGAEVDQVQFGIVGRATPHVMPPPCSIASTFGQVFASGIAGLGCAYHRHCVSPVSGSCDSM